MAYLCLREGDAAPTMNKLEELFNKAVIGAKANSPAIFAGFSIAGVITTSYLAARGAIDADRELGNQKLERKEKLLRWGKHFIPAGISGALTIGCIVGITRSGSRKTVAAQAALAVTERAYSEYREKVIEEFGNRKDQSIRDKVAEERLKKNPPPSQEVLVTGTGSILCCETFTMRYFVSDMEKLRRAMNDLNARLLKHDYATLDDFYYSIGLDRTAHSNQIGWKSDKLLDLEFSTALTSDNRPCITFTYNYTTTL